MPDIIILGAGISGLTAAHELQKAGKDVLVLEEAPAAGGKVESERIDGYLLEAGPNSLRVENQATIDLIESLGLHDRLIEASPASKMRFILKNGKWIKVPSGPIEAITTPLFSLRGKLRILWEPFVTRTSLQDESAASFVTRRLGKEVFDYAADPFITGIYAGDTTKLSMRHAFGAMWRAEQEYGSLIRGVIKTKKAASGKPKIKKRIVSFPNGLSELTLALREKLGPALKLQEDVKGISRSNGAYQIATSEGTFEAPKLIVTVPAYKTSKLLSNLAPELTASLNDIDYPPVAVVYLGYREDQFEKPLAGFGGLIPSSESRKILGVIFSSSNFEGRAPSAHVLLTVIMGGARNRGIAEMTESQILQAATSELANLYPISGAPAFQRMRLWRRAIPQYNVGYSAVLEAIEKAESGLAGLHILGNYRGGISMGSCIRNATELANRLV